MNTESCINVNGIKREGISCWHTTMRDAAFITGVDIWIKPFLSIHVYFLILPNPFELNPQITMPGTDNFQVCQYHIERI